MHSVVEALLRSAVCSMLLVFIDFDKGFIHRINPYYLVISFLVYTVHITNLSKTKTKTEAETKKREKARAGSAIGRTSNRCPCKCRCVYSREMRIYIKCHVCEHGENSDRYYIRLWSLFALFFAWSRFNPNSRFPSRSSDSHFSFSIISCRFSLLLYVV